MDRADNGNGESGQGPMGMFDNAGRNELVAHSMVQQSPLCTGSRNEAMRPHYKARENEAIQ